MFILYWFLGILSRHYRASDDMGSPKSKGASRRKCTIYYYYWRREFNSFHCKLCEMLYSNWLHREIIRLQLLSTPGSWKVLFTYTHWMNMWHSITVAKFADTGFQRTQFLEIKFNSFAAQLKNTLLESTQLWTKLSESKQLVWMGSYTWHEYEWTCSTIYMVAFLPIILWA